MLVIAAIFFSFPRGKLASAARLMRGFSIASFTPSLYYRELAHNLRRRSPDPHPPCRHLLPEDHLTLIRPAGCITPKRRFEDPHPPCSLTFSKEKVQRPSSALQAPSPKRRSTNLYPPCGHLLPREGQQTSSALRAPSPKRRSTDPHPPCGHLLPRKGSKTLIRPAGTFSQEKVKRLSLLAAWVAPTKPTLSIIQED